MMSAMHAGVSGLKTHQKKMDVIGNNIANVNTLAFKSSSVTFSEMMNQTHTRASGANALTGRGGVNAQQTGLGVTTGATHLNITAPGASKSTGQAFDLKINGNSFFVVSDGNSNFFTKAGSFYVDGAGNLAMKSTGHTVMGWQVDENGNIRRDNVSALRILQERNLFSAPEATTQATVGGILDRNSENLNSAYGQIMSFSFFDALGYQHIARFAIKADDALDSAITGQYRVELVDILDGQNQSVPLPPGMNMSDLFGAPDHILEFDPATGRFQGIGGAGVNSQSLNFATLGLGGGFTSDINVDFSQVMWFDNGGTSTVNVSQGAPDGTGAGKRLGSLIGVAVAQDGTIWGSYDNGNTTLFGQIAVASFANPSGLEKVGNNLFIATLNSGDFDGIGQDITFDGGTMNSGVLEMSNVDLAYEFTEMITTQRGFQANSRIISVSDEMINELVNMKR